MASFEKEELNKTQGEEIRVPCSKCSWNTHHKVLLSVDKSGEERDKNFHWDAHYQIIQCQGCKTVSFRYITCDPEDYEEISPDEIQRVIHEYLYPPRIKERKGIGDAISYLPDKVQLIYKETLQALNAKSPVLAGIGLRSLVETVCKEKKAFGNDLVDKINHLATKKILTNVNAKFLHTIRILGNDAAHEVTPLSDEQLGFAMDFVEHLLKDVYILPKQFQKGFS